MTPQTFTAKSHSASRSGVSITGASAPTPALLQRTSTRPKAAQARSASASTDARSVTSHATPMLRTPARASSAAASLARVASTSATTTLAPRAARARAIPRPMPLAPPVTTATLPATSMEASSAQELVGAAALERLPVRRPRVDAVEKRREPRAAGVEAAPRRRCLEREAHLHVGGGEVVPREPRALRELALHEVEVQLDLRIDERAVRASDDRAGDRLHEERHRRRLDPAEDELQKKRRHRRALGVVHPVDVAAARRRVGRRHEPAVAVA